eukprot:CAMPEP_0184400316 /NCGR_PEP_ID=MMETSP0007-20130409/74242_1 /TAXON_ID=97485 /ORGANISM="Prymnesium parvum, Strain Texoma1" /LENGTH=40 /DNA_ID= /DNA_START= /DNA_END= /DNA_ORIENTATION=
MTSVLSLSWFGSSIIDASSSFDASASIGGDFMNTLSRVRT